ncbi:MAG: hypothetical protein WCJ51_01440 [Candidatus Moraniibacteriota bacterium]
MKNFFKNQQGLIWVLLLGGATLALGYFAFFPLLHKITALKDEIEESSIRQYIKKQRLDELPKIRKQDAEIGEQAGRMETLLDKNKAVVLIERLEKIAQETNNEISIAIVEKVAPQKESASKKKEKVVKLVDFLPSRDYLELQISLSGEYAGLVKFMHSLETFEYYCDVESVDITHQNEATSPSAKTQVIINSGDVVNPFGGANPKQADSDGAVQVENRKMNTILGVFFYTNKQ